MNTNAFLPHTVPIWDVQAKAFVDATVDELTATDVAEYLEKWKPGIDALNQKFPGSAPGFDWARIWHDAKDDPTIKVFGSKCNGSLQAILEVSLTGNSGGLVYPKNSNLIYLKHLQSALWNHARRFGGGPVRVYSGVGMAMLLFSRELSKSLGFGGRFGLHAASYAVSFYSDNPLVKHVAGTYYESV